VFHKNTTEDIVNPALGDFFVRLQHMCTNASDELSAYVTTVFEDKSDFAMRGCVQVPVNLLGKGGNSIA